VVARLKKRDAHPVHYILRCDDRIQNPIRIEQVSLKNYAIYFDFEAIERTKWLPNALLPRSADLIARHDLRKPDMV
jgi:hypothetical protein